MRVYALIDASQSPIFIEYGVTSVINMVETVKCCTFPCGVPLCGIVFELPMPMIVFLFFQQIKAIAATGVNLIVSGGKVGELALHYANKHKLMIIRLLSKFDLRRLCKAIGATALPRIVSIFCSSSGIYLVSLIKKC